MGPWGRLGSLQDRRNQIVSNDHFLQAGQGGPLPRASFNSLCCKSEKEWKVLVGRMSLVEVR